jgi:ATP phosphoribosyltransferase regulatory subunit
MQRWLLPEAIEDVLPHQARHLEILRRTLIDSFEASGYQLVMPPLIEYVDSLLSGIGSDLDLRTFKLVDQISGRSLGLRADTTPQVTRIDAHLLNRRGVSRLCYCGSVVHTLPTGHGATREPLQIGAEIYGHQGLEADIEIIGVLAEGLARVGLPLTRIDLGHVGVFRALVAAAGLGEHAARDLFAALQAKDGAAIEECGASLAEPVRGIVRALPALYGDARVLAKAEDLFAPLGDVALQSALDELKRLASALGHLPLSFDLAELRGYDYHNGVSFAGYAEGCAGALARGGRYDGVGRVFGRSRPATGFSLDLRELARLVPQAAVRGAILAPWPEDDAVHAEVCRLRSAGEIVMLALPGHAGSWREAGCDRVLKQENGRWVIEPIAE